MIYRYFTVLILGLSFTSCYEPQRDCKSFKDGAFQFTTEIEGEEKTTTFLRQGDLEIDLFEGKVDSSSIRWINDCEYILKNLRPKNMAEEKSIHMKILSTSDNSYTFEYGIVGESRKSQGTAVRIELPEDFPRSLK